MWKRLLLIGGVLVCPFASAVLACGEAPSAAPAQHPAAKHASIQKATIVELRGKLTFVRCLTFGRTSVGLVVADQTYWLDLRGNKEFSRIVHEAADGTFFVRGELELMGNDTKSFLVRVADIRPSKESEARKIVIVELTGKLQQDFTEILRPYDVMWYVTVDGVRYYLHFGEKKHLAAATRRLEDQLVFVTGVLEQHGRCNIIHVDYFNGVAAPIG